MQGATGLQWRLIPVAFFMQKILGIPSITSSYIFPPNIYIPPYPLLYDPLHYACVSKLSMQTELS